MKIAVLMDPIAKSNIKKDSSLLLMQAAQACYGFCWYLEPNDIWLENGKVFGRLRECEIIDNPEKFPGQWYRFHAEKVCELSEMDVILMRKDPPFDMNYIYLTYLLEMVEKQGCLVINNPRSIRDCNEKLFAQAFPDLCPPTLVSSSETELLRFAAKYDELIVKPLGEMGGSGIHKLSNDSPELKSIIQTMTNNESTMIMMQKFIPEISKGDKRIIMIAGKPVPYALARVPAKGNFLGNLAQGATGVVQELSDRDREIADIVGPVLLEKGLWLVGLDVIGDYLTEINVTSPTCLREISNEKDIDIAGMLLDYIESARHPGRQLSYWPGSS